MYLPLTLQIYRLMRELKAFRAPGGVESSPGLNGAQARRGGRRSRDGDSKSPASEPTAAQDCYTSKSPVTPGRVQALSPVRGSPGGSPSSQHGVDYEAVLQEFVDAIKSLQSGNDELRAQLFEKGNSHADAMKTLARAQHAAERQAALLEDENAALRTRLEAEASDHAAGMHFLEARCNALQSELDAMQQAKEQRPPRPPGPPGPPSTAQQAHHSHQQQQASSSS